MTIIKRVLISLSLSLCITVPGFSATGGDDFSEEFKGNLRQGFSKMSMADAGASKEEGVPASSSKRATGPAAAVVEDKNAWKKFCSPIIEIELDKSGTFFPLFFPGLVTHSEDGLWGIRPVKSPLIRRWEGGNPYQNFRLRIPNLDADWSYLGEKDQAFLGALKSGQIAPVIFQFFVGSQWSEDAHLGHVLMYMGRLNDHVKNWFGLIREFEISPMKLGIGDPHEKRVLTDEEDRTIKTLPTGIKTMAMNLLIKAFQEKALKSEQFPLLTTLFVNIPLVPGEADHPLLGDKTFGIVFSAHEAGGKDKGIIAFNHSHFAGRESELTLFLSAGFNLTGDFPEVPSIRDFLPAGGLILGSRLGDLRTQEMVIFNGDYYGSPLRFEGWEVPSEDGTSAKRMELMTGTQNPALQEKIRHFLATRKN